MTTTQTEPTTTPTFKRSISFKDANGDRCTAQASIKDGEFSMSGEFQNSSGQCFDPVQPANDAQERLLALWRRWHLNDVRAGTPEQEQALRAATEGAEPEALPDFEQRRAYLAAHDLLTVPHPEGGTVPVESCEAAGRERGWKLYAEATEAEREDLAENFFSEPVYFNEEEKEVSDADSWEALAEEFGFAEVPRIYSYGSAWLTEPLPENFQDDLEKILDEIEEEENAEPLTESALRIGELDSPYEKLRDLFGDDRVTALALILGAPLSSALEATVAPYRPPVVTFEGTDYLVGTDDEMDEEWDDALDSYLDECVLPELSDDLARYFDRDAWKADARHDGRAHSLNRYDGGEESVSLSGEEYFAYRQ
jgi:hypothetical protein